MPLKNKLTVNRRNGEIFSPIRQKWLVETPEERVRQEYLCILVNEYDYSLDQIDEELSVTGRGSGDARADFLIWRTPQDKIDGKTALIVVECKADNVTINFETYRQGANYAQYERARFFVTHNNRETKFWKVNLERRMPNFEEIEDIPHADATDKEIEDIISRLKIFKEDEFADLLHQCHNVIRNREKLDPAAAFDEIAKILFIKVCIERRLKSGKQRQNLFTADFLDQQKQLYGDPIDTLFRETKEEYRADKIFKPDETVSLKFNTVREIVKLLERYNLSDTSEDVKGIAFERFLGRTFRGEIGQFFTPRTIVEFMIRMVDPKEGDVICDPASGSGGFLIRFFEIVREKILSDVDREYQKYKKEIESKKYTKKKKAELLRKKYEQLQRQIYPYASRTGAAREDVQTSRIWRLANTCIYGCDANERMARTSKMNMIMHGDGHGGVHYHDGFINVNGIFEERFDIVLTNPPFGANVEESDMIEESHVTVSEEVEKRYKTDYGNLYKDAIDKVKAAVGKPISSLFDLPKTGKIKTEILFIERCLALLKLGGRLGIVLPEGIFNNPSLAYVREYCEDRAFIRAVVSLPQETFFSSGASVKASLLFMQKFTEKEKAGYDALKLSCLKEIEERYVAQKSELQEILARQNFKQEDFLPAEKKGITKEQKKEASEKSNYVNTKLKEEKDKAKKELRELEDVIARETRSLLKERFRYPIFLYESLHVGITATGEADYNELYPNDNMPPGIEKTCLELYQEFLSNPEIFFLSPNVFVVWFNEIERWDVKYFSSRIDSKYPIVCLKSFIREHNNKVNLFEFPDQTFRILGVNNKDGVFHAYDISGKKINQPYKKVDTEDLVYNPYRVNVGSIGIVPNELGDNFISPAYIVFSVDQNHIIPKLLELILKSKWFNPRLRAATSGSVRQNLTFKLLESLEIPLPPLSIQQAIVDRWQRAQVEIAAIKKKIERQRTDIDTLFLKKLGLKLPRQSAIPKAFAVWWNDLLRWSVSYNQAVQKGIDITKGKYPVVELDSIIEMIQYGSSEKANSNGIGTPIIRMNNIVDGRLNLSDLKFIQFSKAEKERLLLKDGDMLFNRTNSKELVGKCAVFHSEGDYVFASYLIRVRADKTKVIPDFLAHTLNSPIGRQQIDALSRQIIGQANINSEELRSLQIPLPPLHIQQEIMQRIKEGQAEIIRKQETVEQKSREIESEVEALILGTKRI